MTDRRTSRVRWTLLLVLWLCVVWGHSLMPADLSSDESSRFLWLVRPFFEALGNTDEQLMTHVIRKAAHFCENVVLMVIATGLSWAWWGQTVGALAGRLAIWACVPAIDELIQSFSPGRSPQVSDVLLDMCGGVVGMLVAWLWRRRARR